MKAFTLILEDEHAKELNRRYGVKDPAPISNSISVSSRLGVPRDYVSLGRDFRGEEVQIPLAMEWGDPKKINHCSVARLQSGKYRILMTRPEHEEDGKVLLLICSDFVVKLPDGGGWRIVGEGDWHNGQPHLRLFVLEKETSLSVVDPGTQEAISFVEWDGKRLSLRSKEEVSKPRDESLDGADFL